MNTPAAPLPRILMIEDDHRLAAMVSSYLRQNGFAVDLSETAQEGLARLEQAAMAGGGSAPGQPGPYALVLLDLMLPDADGLAVCARIRAQPGAAGATPVVMLTAKGDPIDKVIGLELGADDYLGKPFEPRELVARLRAVLRRQGMPAQGMQPARRLLQFGRLDIDLDARSLSIDGQPRAVTPYQFDLLAIMAERPGRVLSREQLLDLVNGEPPEVYDRSIDIQVGRLRAVIEDDPKHPRRILTVRGAGYVFAKLQDG
jgi:DNA-binding response OmpR family regulator